MNKFNNPARNRLAERQAVRAGKVDNDLAAANVAVASTSALSIERADVCPKCKGGMQPSTLAGGRPASFCAQCCVTMPVPEA